MTVETRLGPTFVLAWGEPTAPPLVVLHGGSSNSASWAADAAAYARHFRVYALDLSGEAGKSTPARPPYTGSAWPEWLADALDALGVERARMVGLSLGGWVALRFAAAAPARVERLVVISPGGVGATRRGFVLRAIAYRLLGGRGVRQMARMIFAPSTPPPGVVEAFAFMVRHFKPRGGSLPTIADAELRRVAAPTLLIAGDADRILDTLATRDRLGRLLPRIDTQMIPDGGHALNGTAARALPFLTAEA
jgi:pimeloyl-ACP methyl ester carboxylesterase